MLDRAFPQSRAERERQITEAVVLRATSGALDAPSGTREQVAALANELRGAGAAAWSWRPTAARSSRRTAMRACCSSALGFDGDDDVDAVYEVVQRLDAEPCL